jgi:hypothetical protein
MPVNLLSFQKNVFMIKCFLVVLGKENTIVYRKIVIGNVATAIGTNGFKLNTRLEFETLSTEMFV